MNATILNAMIADAEYAIRSARFIKHDACDYENVAQAIRKTAYELADYISEQASIIQAEVDSK